MGNWIATTYVTSCVDKPVYIITEAGLPHVFSANKQCRYFFYRLAFASLPRPNSIVFVFRTDDRRVLRSPSSPGLRTAGSCSRVSKHFGCVIGLHPQALKSQSGSLKAVSMQFSAKLETISDLPHVLYRYLFHPSRRFCRIREEIELA